MGSKTVPSTFLKNIAQNGIGRHVCQLQRLTLSLCKSHPSSSAARKFVEDDVLDFTKGNPGIVFYVKPRRHRAPVLTAEFLNGYKEMIDLSGLTKEEITQWIGLMRGRSGAQIMRLRKDWHTDTPSIQGMWNPFLFKDTKLNVTDKMNKSLSEYISHYKSATQKLIEMKKHQKQQKELEQPQEESTRETAEKKKAASH